MSRDRKLAYLALLGNVLIWGAALPVVKPSLAFISPFQFLFYRYLVAAVVMAPIVWIIWPKQLTIRQLVIIIALEVLQVAVSLTLLYQALAITPALTASLLGSSAPIFVTLGGILFLKERQERNEWLGLGLSVLGTLILIFASTQNHGSGNSPLGVILMLGYLLTNLIYLLSAKVFYRRLNKLFIAGLGSLIGLIAYALITPIIDFIPPPSLILASTESVVAILYMGLLGSSLALALLLYGQSKIEASEASLFTYLQPLVYLPLSLLWLRESISPYQLLGLFIVVAGVLLAQLRVQRKPGLKIP
jgi:drug/metabolite transporter (DMT)-like permease